MKNKNILRRILTVQYLYSIVVSSQTRRVFIGGLIFIVSVFLRAVGLASFFLILRDSLKNQNYINFELLQFSFSISLEASIFLVTVTAIISILMQTFENTYNLKTSIQIVKSLHQKLLTSTNTFFPRSLHSSPRSRFLRTGLIVLIRPIQATLTLLPLVVMIFLSLIIILLINVYWLIVLQLILIFSTICTYLFSSQVRQAHSNWRSNLANFNDLIQSLGNQTNVEEITFTQRLTLFSESLIYRDFYSAQQVLRTSAIKSNSLSRIMMVAGIGISLIGSQYSFFARLLEIEHFTIFVLVITFLLYSFAQTFTNLNIVFRFERDIGDLARTLHLSSEVAKLSQPIDSVAFSNFSNYFQRLEKVVISVEEILNFMEIANLTCFKDKSIFLFIDELGLLLYDKNVQGFTSTDFDSTVNNFRIDVIICSRVPNNIDFVIELALNLELKNIHIVTISSRILESSTDVE